MSNLNNKAPGEVPEGRPGSIVPYGTNTIDPTLDTYGGMSAVFNFFNRELFGARLPNCLITLQRSRRACGYYDHQRFVAADQSHHADEIALNPRTWNPTRGDIKNLATLVHEMVHCKQAHFGKPGRGGYHNREWARQMIEIGLVPSATGEPGGRPTGRHVSHYVREDGPFDRACKRLLGSGFRIPYEEVGQFRELSPLALRRARSRAESKTTYTCPNCDPAVHVWGRPSLQIICGACDASLVAEQVDEENGWLSQPRNFHGT